MMGIQIDQNARIEARKQWSKNPCGALPTHLYDLRYFNEVEKERYRQQYWHKDFFDFTSFADKRVLEIGVGHGTDLKQFARAGAEYYGIDITDVHLELTRYNFELEQLRVNLRNCDATRICFPDKYFDCVYSFGVIHHIPEVDLVLSEVRRVMKPGASFQIAVYHKWSIHALIFLLASVINGVLFKSKLSAALARIEQGADGKDIRPYVRLYSAKQIIKIFNKSGFSIQKLEIHQINFERKKLKWLNFLRPLERVFGWYIAVIATA